MSEKHIISLHTYGKTSQNIPDAEAKRGTRRVSTLKIGSGVVAPVLLSLFGDRARDVSSSRASYTYIYIRGRVPKLRYNWLFVSVSSEQLAQVERICRRDVVNHPYICLWQSGHWIAKGRKRAVRCYRKGLFCEATWSK